MRLTAREIAAAVGGFHFTFCAAENFTTAERLFHILHMRNISLKLFVRTLVISDYDIVLLLSQRSFNP